MPLETLRPTGSRIIVKRYLKPETVKGIIIPEAYRPDDTLSLWEFVKASPKAYEVLGTSEITEGTLLQTPPRRGIYIDTVDGEDYFMLEAHEIMRMIPW